MFRYSKLIGHKGMVDLFLGTDIPWAEKHGFVTQNVEQSEKDGQWYLADKCPRYTDEEIAEKERERINKLTVTKRVFALALEQFGVSYTQLKEVIASNERAQLEWDLCVELERGNPLLDQLAPTFNITSEQLDYIFKVANE